MERQYHFIVFIFVTLMFISFSLFSGATWAQEEFDELRVLIEVNATDGDAGFQAKGDAEGWKEIRIDSPSDMKLFNLKAFDGLRDQGLTEIFFESEEPSCDEVPLLEFLDRFPEGEYLWTGKTHKGGKLEGEAILSHNLPSAPTITAPVEGEILDSSQAIMITWEEGEGLGDCDPGNGFELLEASELFGYQVVVEREEPEPLMVFTVDVSNNYNSVTIPTEFLEEGAIYKFEVVAIEARENDDEETERGNQTISESFFCTTGIEGNCELPEEINIDDQLEGFSLSKNLCIATDFKERKKLCSDGIDNDCDGLTDENDLDCEKFK